MMLTKSRHQFHLHSNKIYFSVAFRTVVLSRFKSVTMHILNEYACIRVYDDRWWIASIHHGTKIKNTLSILTTTKVLS